MVMLLSLFFAVPLDALALLLSIISSGALPGYNAIMVSSGLLKVAAETLSAICQNQAIRGKSALILSSAQAMNAIAPRF